MSASAFPSPSVFLCPSRRAARGVLPAAGISLPLRLAFLHAGRRREARSAQDGYMRVSCGVRCHHQTICGPHYHRKLPSASLWQSTAGSPVITISSVGSPSHQHQPICGPHHHKELPPPSCSKSTAICGRITVANSRHHAIVSAANHDKFMRLTCIMPKKTPLTVTRRLDGLWISPGTMKEKPRKIFLWNKRFALNLSY